MAGARRQGADSAHGGAVSRTGEVYPDGRASYRCDQCGVVQPWNDEWLWFGSWRDAEGDDPSSIFTYCCRLHAEFAARDGKGGAPPVPNKVPEW